MDKYKILFNSSNQTIFRDIIMSVPDDFFCVSTSSYWEDIKGHCKFLEPDVFVYVVEENDSQYVSIFKNIKNSINFSKIPIIVVTTPEIYQTFDIETMDYLSNIILRPITISNLFSSIRRYLDAKKAEEEKIIQEQLEAEIEKKKQERKTILIVDDDKNVLKLLKAALEDKYTVVTMVAGKMAEKYLETRTCDAILLDYQMPVETGPEVFAKIKEIETAKDIPIIFLTGVADKEKIAEVLRLKPQGYLLKPIETDRLMETIERVIEENA